MALATKCPHCQTTFRVAHDQLKLRAGLVRCGHCKEIFNGIEHLLPPAPSGPNEASAAIPTPIQMPTPFPPFPLAPVPAPESVTISDPVEQDTVIQDAALAASHDFGTPETDVSSADEMQYPADDSVLMSSDHTIYNDNSSDDSDAEETLPQDPLQRMTLMDFTHGLPDELDSGAGGTASQEISNTENVASTSLDTAVHDELDAAIDDLQRKPWRKAKKRHRPSADSISDIDTGEDEPGFVKRGRRQQRFGKIVRLFFSVASSLLLIAALVQGIYIFRDQIAGIYPPAKPALIRMCEALACRIKLPAQIALISIESSELQTLAAGKDMFVLTTLLHNKSIAAQEWPNIELTLNDNDGKPLLRRVFKATDYINKPADIAQGIAPANERLVKLTFSLSQIKASGYRVYLFYP